MDIISKDKTSASMPETQGVGFVQPHGYVLVIETEDHSITAASANTRQLFDLSPEQIFACGLIELLGISALHAIRNAQSRPGFLTSRTALGTFEINGKACVISAFGDREQILLEIEENSSTTNEPETVLSSLSFLLAQFQTVGTQQALLEKTAKLLRHLSGYDRVMAYKFDAGFDGTVIAEARSPSVAPFLDLRFPSAITPPKARAHLAEQGIRIIADAQHKGVPIVQADPKAKAQLTRRGRLYMPSATHQRYMQSMDVQASLALALTINDALWGMVVFHAKDPFIPSQEFQRLVELLHPVLQLKLQSVQQQEALDTARALDRKVAALEAEFSDGEEIEQLVRRIAPDLMQAFNADGAVLILKDQNLSLGTVPNDIVTLAIIGDLRGSIMAKDTMPGQFDHGANGMGGFLAIPIQTSGALLLFRPEQEHQTLWASGPADIASMDEGFVRENAFSTRLETDQTGCKAWSKQDLVLAERLKTLFEATHKQSLLDSKLAEQTRTIEALRKAALNRFDLEGPSQD